MQAEMGRTVNSKLLASKSAFQDTSDSSREEEATVSKSHTMRQNKSAMVFNESSSEGKEGIDNLRKHPKEKEKVF